MAFDTSKTHSYPPSKAFFLTIHFSLFLSIFPYSFVIVAIGSDDGLDIISLESVVLEMDCQDCCIYVQTYINENK